MNKNVIKSDENFLKLIKDFMTQNHVYWDGTILDDPSGHKFPKICVYYYPENEPNEAYLEIDPCTFTLYSEYFIDRCGDDPDEIRVLDDLSLSWSKYQLEHGLCTPEDMREQILSKKHSVEFSANYDIKELQRQIRYIESQKEKILSDWDNLYNQLIPQENGKNKH